MAHYRIGTLGSGGTTIADYAEACGNGEEARIAAKGSSGTLSRITPPPEVATDWRKTKKLGQLDKVAQSVLVLSTS